MSKAVRKPYDPDEELRSAWNTKLDGRPIKDVVTSASKRGNIDPAFLLSSAWQEGLNKAVLRPDEISLAYENAAKKDKELANFPIDGFYNYGLDTFGNNYENIKKYLPEGFDKNFHLYDALNEKKEKIKTVAFRNNEDALVAKAAFLNYERDRVGEYAKSRGLDLTKDQNASNYLTLSSYNAGYGNARKMVDEYIAAPDRAAYLNQGLTRLKGVDKNIAPRVKRIGLANELLNMKYGGKMPKRPRYQDGTEDPILGNNKPQINPTAKNVGIDIWGNAINSPVPVNPNAPKEQQIIALDQQQNNLTPQSGIVPLSQFYNTSTDNYGNSILTGTGNYVNSQGQVNTAEQQQYEADRISQQNYENAQRRQANKEEAERYSSLGITAINAYFNKQNTARNQRTDRRAAIMQEIDASILNPYLEGTGSQAIFEKGGSIHIKPENRGKFTAAANRAGKSVQAYAAQILGNKEDYSPTLVKRANFARNAAKWHQDGGEITGDQAGFQVTDGGKAEIISGNNHSNPMIEFKGKEHKEGGIGVQYGNNIAEVENKEIGWVDDQGGLNIFGKLKLPGSNTTFRKVAKDIASQEDKVNGLMSKYTNILNNGNATDPYQETSQSTAKVMFKSLDKQSKQIAEKKEALASYQNLILTMVENGSNKMNYGGKLPRKMYAEGGSIDPEDPASIQAIIDKYSGGKAPLRAEDFIEVSKKYGVPLNLMLAQAITESNIGTKGRAVRTKNIFNVGNTDDGTESNQDSWKAGLERYAKVIRDEYSVNGVIDVDSLINNGFVRPRDNARYASNPNYERDLKSLITSFGDNIGSSNSTPFTYKGINFSNKDAQQLYSIAKGDEEHPMNSTDQADFQRLEQYLGLGDPYPKTFKKFKGKDASGNSFSAPGGLTPEAFYKDPAVIKALKDDQTYSSIDDANWGPEHQKVWNNLSQTKREEILKRSTTGNTGVGTGTNTVKDAQDYVPKYEPIGQQKQVPGTGLVDTPYGLAQRDATPFSDKVNIGIGDKKRGWQSPLAIEQIAPELLTIATNRQEPVEQLTYQPDLLQTFDISYQLGRNENQSSFNQAAKIAEGIGSVEALSQLAAQKYNADQQYNMQEVQGNAQQRLGTYNQNVATLNDAKVKNLALIADQQTKQAQAEFNTRRENIGAFTSISGKVLQNTLENRTYNAYANLFKHYGFDKMGNVTFEPDKVAQKFTAGEAQQFGLLSAQQGANAIMNGDFNRQFRKVKNDDGSTTTTEVLGRNRQIQQEYQTLKNQGFDDSLIGNMLRAKYPETISQE